MKKTYAVWLPWLILLFAELFLIFQYSFQLSTGVLFEPIKQDYAVTTFAASFLISTYYYMYVGFQTPAGIIMDRVGPRRLLSSGALLCSAGAVVFAVTHYYPLAIFAKICMGGGAAFAFVGALYLIREWFSPERQAFLIGMTEVLAMLGAVRGIFLLGFAMRLFNWRICMLFYAAYFFVAAVGCAWWVRDKNPLRHHERAVRVKPSNFSQSFKAVVGHRLAWLNGLYIGLMYSVATVFAALWATPFLMVHLNINDIAAAKIALMIYLGMAIGCPLFGLLTQHYKKRRPLLIISGLSSILVLSLIIYGPYVSILSVRIEMLLLGICSSGYVLSFIIANDIAPAGIKNTYNGFTNSCCLLTAPILQPLIGILLDNQLTQHPHNVLLDYQKAMSVMIVALLLATCIAWWMPETYTIENP